RQNFGALVVIPVRYFIVFDAVDHVAQIVQVHRGAVPIGNDKAPVGGSVQQLSIGLHRVRLMGACQDTGGQINVGALDRRLDLVDSDMADGELLRINLNPHRIRLGAKDLHLSNSTHHGDA